MKKHVRSFISQAAGLSEIRRFIQNADQIRSGRKIPNFSHALPRELVANWLITAVANYEAGSEVFRFTSDPDGDGVIYNVLQGIDYPTEHVMVPPAESVDTTSIESRIRAAVQKKQAKGGLSYAGGKMLVVLVNHAGDVHWHPNAATGALPPNDFEHVWAVGLHSVKDGQFTYGVTRLDPEVENVPVWLVDIAADFESWAVRRIQFPHVITASWDFGVAGQPLRTGDWM
jgi:hypothetical protein